jgi:phosphocarrier protein
MDGMLLMAANTRTVIVANPHGLHFRVCAAIVETVAAFDAQVTICRGIRKARANSVLELLMLAAQQGTKLILRATGPEADALLDALADLF